MNNLKFLAWDKKEKRLSPVWSIGFKGWDGQEDSIINYVEIERDGTVEVFENEVVLMQFTGVKDKHGVEIFEGDIICIKTKHYDSDKKKDYWKKEIVWIKSVGLCYTKAYFDLTGKRKWDNDESYEDFRDDWEECDNIEVIGNIYENSELLEVNG